MNAPRLVVTGMGIVSPLGCGLDPVWQRLLAGRSGIRSLPDDMVADLAATVGGTVPTVAEDPEAGFDPDRTISPKDQKKMDRFIHFAMMAADEALAQAGWAPQTDAERDRTATVIASGVGGFPAMIDAVRTCDDKGPRRVSPFTVPSFLVNLAAGQVSIKHGFRGPLGAPVTACAAGVQAIGDAARMIRAGEADIALCGGAEACMTRVTLAGFAAARALSTGYGATPEQASRPFDEGRDGFVMGEGAGILVLEEYEHAKARGAEILAEFGGYGLSGDAYHITSPAEDGDGGFRSMQMALDDAKLPVDAIGYINAHGTSTPKGDEIEAGSVRRLFGGSGVSMSSTKSAIGHLLGGAGSVEAIFAIQAVRTGVLPPTLNLENPSASVAGMDLVPLVAKEKKVTAALSNSFGFGGTNASVIFKAIA